jgi:hypothetical protein
MDANLISAIGSLTGPALRRRSQTFVEQRCARSTA